MGLLSDLITYVHEPVQNHLQEHSGLDDITRPRRCLQRISENGAWSAGVHVAYILLRVIETRPLPCAMVILSNMVCAWTESWSSPSGIVDIVFYKSLAVLIGFLMSFRA